MEAQGAQVAVPDGVISAIADVRSDASATDWCLCGFEGGAEGMTMAVRAELQSGRDEMARNQARANLLEGAAAHWRFLWHPCFTDRQSTLILLCGVDELTAMCNACNSAP